MQYAKGYTYLETESVKYNDGKNDFYQQLYMLHRSRFHLNYWADLNSVSAGGFISVHPPSDKEMLSPSE